jgi:hypothetical protein
MAHGLHRLSETIRDKFSDFDLLISNTKKVFLKAPTWVGTFKEKCLNLSLPPQPIITRWGTWLDAAFYYGMNFDKVKEVVDTFNNSIKNELSVILSNFQCITDTITCLEK